MNTESKGNASSRFRVKLSAVLLGLLFYGLLDFILDDLGMIQEPNYQKIEARYVAKGLVDQKEHLNTQIEGFNNQVKRLSDNQKYIKNNSDNLKVTIDQMLEIQKSSLQKNIMLSDKDKTALNESQKVFLSYQTQLKNLNDDILKLQKSKNIVEENLDKVDATLKEQRKAFNAEYTKLSDQHRFFQAKLQVSLLLILLVIGVVLFRKYHGYKYSLMITAITIPIIIKIYETAYEYFPSIIFKYLLILSLIVTVIYGIKKLIQSMVSPKPESLLKIYREAYQQFLCPVCEFPIQMGPRRFLFWTRRTNRNLKLPKTKECQDFEAYHCPHCTTELFKQCPSCQKVRHALLPSCTHCGQQLKS